MKNLKKYFKMIITAVICFATGIFSKKRAKGNLVEILSEGQAVSSSIGKNAVPETGNKGFTERSSSAGGYRSYSQAHYLKKVFFWLQGPGDRLLPAEAGFG